MIPLPCDILMEQVEKVWILWEWGVSIYFIVKFAGFIGAAVFQGADLEILPWNGSLAGKFRNFNFGRERSSSLKL
jgi:hypothetical protein